MPIRKTGFNIKGMTRDMAVSKFSPELAYENKNLRIIATDDNTSYGLVNEKGTAEANVVIEGIPIGQEIINDSLILFTTSGEGDAVITINGAEGVNLTLPNASGNAQIEHSSNYGDHIYKFNIDSTTKQLTGGLLYSGDLGFSAGCPIESIGVYENQQIQKVYWTDGINQPRVINIAEQNPQWNNNSFNFVKAVKYGGGITVSKNEISFGSFAPGVIQYCFTYYDLYGAETNIFYTSPLYYVSPSTRGASPEETVSCSFTISVSSYDTRFEYLRIYSILRTSINATPQVRKVADIALKNASGTIVYTDTGTVGETLDPTDLLYIGGEAIFAGTIAQKDNTLFLGDITIGREPISSAVKTAARSLSPSTVSKTIQLPDDANVGNYSYTSQLNKSNQEITYYRRGETYRLGFQAQHYTGRWSDVVFIKDLLISTPISTSTGSVSVNNIQVDLGSSIINSLVDAGYIKARPMVVFPDANDRTIICEGVCCPTVYNVEDRYTNSPYAQASWFFRPNAINDGAMTFSTQAKYGKYAEFRHNYPIPDNSQRNAEIQCISNTPTLPVLQATTNPVNPYEEPSDRETWVAQNKECYYVDQSVFTFHSPDVEFDDTLKTFEASGSNIGFRIVGYVPIHASYSDIDMETSTPANYANGKKDGEYQYKPAVAPGFIKTQVTTTTAESQYGWRSLLSGIMWFDDFSDSINENAVGTYPVGFVVYPWHKEGAINGAARNATNSILQHKTMSIFRFSRNSKMLSSGDIWERDITGATKFDSDEVSMVKIPGQGSTSSVYYGNIDKIIIGHGKPKGKFGLRDYDPSMAVAGNSPIIDEAGVSTLPGAYPIMTASPSGATIRTALEDPSEYGTNYPNDRLRERWNVRITDDYSKVFNYPYVYSDYLVASSNEVFYRRYIFDDSKTVATDPVSMKYKSTPHLVVALSNSGSNQVILPKNSGGASTTTSYGHQTFWGSTTGASQGTIPVSGSEGFLWLGELYRKDINQATRFGGSSDEALENNRWLPAGEPVDLIQNDATPVSSCNIVWSQGDTYYQRYDCLKTFPFTNEDTNSVSDTLSFMCETRVNIDGRYDKNRGQLSTLYINSERINLINQAYSQQNNYFTYRGLNPNKVNSTFFPNTITWTKTKTMGETVDSWTGITLASTLDVDGDKGRVRALRRYNNDLLSFQDRGISHILYNENVQIASTTGVPIEIANSGKVSGKRYISNHIGCINKWSICSAPAGIYFMDDIGKDIYLFNGQLNNISDKYGFHSWIISNFSDIKVWNPRDFNTQGEITYYDKVNGDVMFITNNTCLAFSEPLGSFSSFYSYEKTPYFSTMNDRGILWHIDDSLAVGDANYGKYQAWWHREGDYNYFYNVYKPYSVTVVANEHPTEDKVFNNLEYRGDTFDVGANEGAYLFSNTFTKLETWNEYQRGIANLNDVKDNPSNLKKKFRIWRANIPRNTENKGGDTTHIYTRDRMRNPWLYIKLSKELTEPPTPSEEEEETPVITEREINNKKSVLHDLIVYYFE